MIPSVLAKTGQRTSRSSIWPATFSVQFATPGPHVLTAAVDADRLTTDDARIRVVDVPPPVRTLLVDGAPHAELELDAPEEALGVLREARERHPGDAELLLGLATLSRDAGDLRSARDYAEALAQLVPEDETARQLLAELSREPLGEQ